MEFETIQLALENQELSCWTAALIKSPTETVPIPFPVYLNRTASAIPKTGPGARASLPRKCGSGLCGNPIDEPCRVVHRETSPSQFAPFAAARLSSRDFLLTAIAVHRHTGAFPGGSHKHRQNPYTVKLGLLRVASRK